MTEAEEVYGHQLRIRACGICISDHKLLMIGHRSLVADGLFWSPPGGGVEFNETVPEAVKREFLEETGLSVQVEELLFVNEFIKWPFHAIELFFRVRPDPDTPLIKGTDPELPRLIESVRYMSMAEIKALPSTHVHTFIRDCDHLEQLTNLKGFITRYV